MIATMAAKRRAKDGERDGRGKPGKNMRELQSVTVQLEGFPQELWEEHCRRMQLCVARGAYGSAHQALNEFIHRCIPGSITVDSPIWALDGLVEVRVLEMLEAEGYDTVRSLILASDTELLRLTDISDVRLAQIRSALDAHFGP